MSLYLVRAFRGYYGIIYRIRIIAIVVFLFPFDSHASNVRFYNINNLYGISMREIASVCKDNNGFIWASSKTGILRLTDDDYRIYQLPYETTDIFNVKLVYQNSILVAYTNNGQIFYYNAQYNRFDLLINMSVALKNTHLIVYGLLIDDQGVFWIASSVGLYRYNSKALKLVGDDSSDIYNMTWFDRNHLFVARVKGIWLIDTRSMTSRYIYENTSITPFHVSKLYFDKTMNMLWIGTMSNGIFQYNFERNSFSQLLPGIFPKQPILAIEVNTDSTLLIGIDGQGIWELNARSNRLLNVYKENADDPSSLRGNGVYDIYCESNKRVWVSTFSGGLSYFDQASPIVNQIIHKTNNPNSLINNDVNSIIEDRRGNIWFATNNGISCWNVVSNRWDSYYHNKQRQAQVFLCLCEDDLGRIWAGTYSSGVYVIDGKTRQEVAHYSQEENGEYLISNFIIDIFKDSQGDIWMGGVHGEIICYQAKENKFRTYSSQPINAFAELSSSQILLGCTYGLCLLNKNTGEVKLLLEGYLVYDILIRENDAWICTGGEGLIRLDIKNQTTEKYTMQSGLPSDFVNSIIYSDDFMWLGTEGGLCRFNPKDKSAITYSSIFPLARVSFNRSSLCKLQNGQLAWGTNNGAVLFYPSAIRQIQPQGKIFFQDLTISGRSIRDSATFNLTAPLDSLQDITLRYNQNTLTLELLPIGVTAGSKFSWKMEGLDEDWSQPTSHRILTYTNIPSGYFLLKIRLYDSSLSHIIAERTLTINMIPPFWKTGWFILLMIVFISGILFSFFWYYITRLKQFHSEEKIRFFTNTAHDIRTSLTLIIAPIEQLNKELKLSNPGRYFLNLATEQVRRLTMIATQLLDFQKTDIGKEQLSLHMVDIVKLIMQRRLMFETFANGRNIELLFTTDQQIYLTAIDESKMEKIVDNLISNAVKYSHPHSQVQIILTCNSSHWKLEVKDQGIGISRKAQRQLFREFYRGDNAMNEKVVGSGIGLMLVKSYVTMHGGSISCISQENIGSSFQMIIPHKEVFEEKKTTESTEIDEHFPDSQRDDALHLKSQHREITILIVEDNDDLRNFMQYALQDIFQVTTAENGVVAWESIQNQIPDLIVSDVLMPNMDGFELCKLIKSTYETSHIPVILLTALSAKAEQLHGLGLGADDYLTKPFDMALLTQRIRSIIRNREAVRLKALKIKGNGSEPMLANELNDLFVKKMVEIVRLNISNTEFGKDEFASAMNVSPSLLYKKVKSLTDQSPTDFIKTVRLNHALELLQTRKYSVTEVSELCGFASIGYFSTVFRKHYGKSPTEVIE